MTIGTRDGARILVIEDVEETRDGQRGRHNAPELVLVSPGRTADDAVGLAERLRRDAGLGAEVPVVVFCVESIAQGAVVRVDANVYLTRPDSFDQLRALLRR